MKNSRPNTLVFPALLSAVFFLIFGLIICPLNYKGTTPVSRKVTETIYQNTESGNGSTASPETTESSNTSPKINYNSYWIPNELRTPQEDLNSPSYASPFACFNLQTAIDYDYANRFLDYYNYFKSRYDNEIQNFGMASDLVEFYYLFTKTLFEKTSSISCYTLDVYFYKNTQTTTIKIVKEGFDTFGFVVTDNEGVSYYNGYFDGIPIYSGAEKISTDFFPLLTENDDFLLTQLGVENKALYYQNAVLGHVIDLGSVASFSTSKSKNISERVVELGTSETSDSFISIVQKRVSDGKIINSPIFLNLVANYSRGKLNASTGVLQDGSFDIKAIGFSVLANDMQTTNQMLSALTIVGFTKQV